MKTYPSLPRLGDPPDDLLAGGHLWLQELVAGRHLRFRMADSGLIEFGDRDTTFDPGEPSPPYAHAVRHVRARFDRDALRAAADDDPERFVFFGQATVAVGLDYDWEATPPLLGFDVWDRDREAFLPPDATERGFERLGLDAVNAFEKERHVRDFQPDRYAVPDSAWYDGPAAGVVVRNTRGATAVRENPAVETGVSPGQTGASPRSDAPTRTDASGEPAADLGDRLVTTDRLERALGSLDAVADRGGDTAPVDPADLHDRVFELLVREEYARLGGDGRTDWDAVRSAVGEPVRQWLRERAR